MGQLMYKCVLVSDPDYYKRQGWSVVVVRKPQFPAAADWIELDTTVCTYDVTRLDDEGTAFWIDRKDVAFELKMRFG